MQPASTCTGWIRHRSECTFAGTMRRLGMLGIVACAIALLVFALRGRQRPAAPPAGARSPAGPRLVAAESSPISSWLGQPQLGARRIAGRVTFAGQPVGGANVRVTTGE